MTWYCSFRVLPNETSGCDVYEERIESLEKEEEIIRGEGRQLDEERRKLQNKLRGKEEDLNDFRQTIEALEKALEDPDKVTFG